MRAIGVNEFGGPEALELLDVPVPEPGPGEVRVKVELAGINFIDVYMRSGAYRTSHTYQTPLPMVLGMEGAGEVDAVGEGVDELATGQQVAWCIHRGAYAEYAVVPAWKLVPVPNDVPLDIACALQLQGCTAHYLTHSAAPLGPRDTCLVHAGAGGVGQLLIQLAKARGATVITTVGSPDKAEIARAAGTDHVILYRETDFLEAVKELTDGTGADVVYDAVGRDTIDRSIRCLRRRGTIVNYGGASGLVESISPLALAEAGSVFFTRPHLADYMATTAEIRSRTETLFALWREGRLRVAIDRTLPLEDAAEAHRLIQGRETRGKLLLEV
jgi:NADPH2:quinone reductase